MYALAWVGVITIQNTQYSVSRNKGRPFFIVNFSFGFFSKQ